MTQIDIPEKLAFLLEPYRYKVAYGGRGGMKSWTFARTLLAIAASEKKRVLCAREIHKSIKDSVHKLLSDQIKELELQDFYEIQKTTILGANGSEFLYDGLHHNVDNIKSTESIDICWVEEAQAVSAHSWRTLVPTIRKAGSEIWVSFNPVLEDDPTYQLLVADPPTGAKVVKVGWQDNPWHSKESELERRDLKRKDPIAYKNVWGGECKQAVDGAIFAKELQKAAEEHRITRVPVQEGVPVHTYWDLGQSDNTAIWFVQMVGKEYRLVDYYECNGQKMPHYFEVLARRGYLYGNHCLPHDAEADQIAAQKNIKEQFRDACKNNPALGKPENIKIVERTPKKAIAINSARTIFDRCVFDKEATKDGRQCLAHYRYQRDEETGKAGKNPVHDIWSNGADAFLAVAQYAKPPVKKQKIKYNNSWAT